MNVLHIFRVGPQHLGYAPGLRDAATRPLRRVAVEYLANLPYAAISEVFSQWSEPLVRLATRSIAARLVAFGNVVLRQAQGLKRPLLFSPEVESACLATMPRKLFLPLAHSP